MAALDVESFKQPIITLEEQRMSPPRPSQISSQTPYQCLSKSLSFPDLDQDEWWRRTAPVLCKMLSDANYDVHRQYQYLVFFAQHVIPFLGLSPSSNHPNHFGSYFGTFGLLGLSINFQKSKQTVRIGVEPMTHCVSTPERDPCNRLGIQAFLMDLGVLGIEMDLQSYHRLLVDMTLTATEERSLWKHGSLPRLFRTQNLIAFDLATAGNILLKPYFFPQAKSKATGRSTAHLTFNALRNVDPEDRLTPALKIIEDYMDDQGNSTPTFVDGVPASHVEIASLSCDLVSPDKARYKVYIHDSRVNLDRVADLWTLGGKLKDCPGNLEGLEILRKLWCSLAIPDGHYPPYMDAPKEGEDLASQVHNRAFLIFNFEIRPGSAYPQPKAYLPVSGMNDRTIAKAVTSCFQDFGWTDHAATYMENLASYFPSFDIDQKIGLQDSISFSYSPQNGPYVSVYFEETSFH